MGQTRFLGTLDKMDRLHMSQNGKCPQSNMYEAGKKESKIVFKKMVYYKIFSKTEQSSSEIRGLCLIKWPSKILQNLPHFWNKLEAFHQAISSSIYLLFLKSVMYKTYLQEFLNNYDRSHLAQL